MERGGQQPPLSYRDDPTGLLSVGGLTEYAYPRTDRLDPGGADEDRFDRGTVDAVDVHPGFEGLGLPPESVAADCHVDPADGLLAVDTVEDALGQQDHPRAGSVYGKAFADVLAQRLHEAVARRELDHRGRFAAGDDQALDLVELLGT